MTKFRTQKLDAVYGKMPAESEYLVHISFDNSLLDAITPQ